ncbi:hypothetical protein DMN91_007774, partial [Ooceraea biroi]
GSGGGIPRRRHRRTTPAVRLETPAGTDGRRDAPRRVCAFVRVLSPFVWTCNQTENINKSYKKDGRERKLAENSRAARGSRIVRQRIAEARVNGCWSIDSSRCEECLGDWCISDRLMLIASN